MTQNSMSNGYSITFSFFLADLIGVNISCVSAIWMRNKWMNNYTYLNKNHNNYCKDINFLKNNNKACIHIKI